MSRARLQENLLNFFEAQNSEANGPHALADCILEFEDASFESRIYCHKAILAAQSDWFHAQLAQPGPLTLTLTGKKRNVMLNVVRFCYFGEFDSTLSPMEALDVMMEARNLSIDGVSSADIEHLILPHLTMTNCLQVALHEELKFHVHLTKEVCEFIGTHIFDLLQGPERASMLGLGRTFIIQLVKYVGGMCADPNLANNIVRFVLEWSQFESMCDILKECKTWPWTEDPQGMTLMRGENHEAGAVHSDEWHIPNLKRWMSQTEQPVRFIIGEFFQWCVRLDMGQEGRFRIVYEAAIESNNPNVNLCIKRFPAAMFAWQVMFRGQNVFHERPVFICFPENVSLHWSTTLPVAAADLEDDDEITIMVSMMENPLVSLILYHFSSDLKTTVTSEDILNRLPHIEFRCVSSYSLFKQVNS